MDPSLVKRIVEAALFASHQPLPLAQLEALFADGEPVGTEAVAQALAELTQDYTERGVELVEVGSGFRFQVQRAVHPFVAKLWTERQTRYSRALLETLALIAYRQPITRGEIEQIRGVAVSTQIIRTLEEREWVRVVGHRDVPGKPALFGTTRQFLDYFNLKSLDELPPLSELRDLEDLTPELALIEAGVNMAPAASLAVDTEIEVETVELTPDALADAAAGLATESAVPDAAGDGDAAPASDSQDPPAAPLEASA